MIGVGGDKASTYVCLFRNSILSNYNLFIKEKMLRQSHKFICLPISCMSFLTGNLIFFFLRLFLLSKCKIWLGIFSEEKFKMGNSLENGLCEFHYYSVKMFSFIQIKMLKTY